MWTSDNTSATEAQFTQTRVGKKINYIEITMSSKPEISQTRGEEIANSISHGVGVVAVLIGAPWLIISAIQHGSAWYIVGVSVFAVSMALLYTFSMLYHAIPHPRAKRIFRILDHSAIFLLIAGTYTPFTLGVLRGGWGWSLFGVIWGIAIIGIVLKSFRTLWHRMLSNTIYLTMGWLIVIAVWPLWQHVPLAGLLLLLGGGLAYTGGILFYNTKKLRYSHLVWHLFVITGTTLHYFAVLKFAA